MKAELFCLSCGLILGIYGWQIDDIKLMNVAILFNMLSISIGTFKQRMSERNDKRT